MNSNEYDLVTLAQLERKEIRLYQVRFCPKGKLYTYKSTLVFELGDKATYKHYAAVPAQQGTNFGAVVEVVKEVTHIEPGVQYNWLIGRVEDFRPLEEYQAADNEARNVLQMVKAKMAMKEFLGQLSVAGIELPKPGIRAIEKPPAGSDDDKEEYDDTGAPWSADKGEY